MCNLFFGLFTSSICLAQGFYLNSNSSYNFSLASIPVSANYSPSKTESVHGSFGKGFDLGIGGGYGFSKNIAAEINFTYLMGGKIDFQDSYDPNTPPNKETLKGRMYRLIPTIKISTGEKIKPYAKVGLILGLGTKLIDESLRYNYMWSETTNRIEETTEFNGGLSLGFKGNLGADFSLNDKLGLFAELNFVSQAWAPKNATVTKYLVNGEDKLSSMDLRDKETEFVESYDPNATIEPYQTNKSLKLFLPFSSWGINIGLKFTFGKKE